MPAKTLTPTKKQIDELRSRFLHKYENDPPQEPFHPVDLHRVKNEDLWCTRYLEMYDLDMDVAFDNLWGTCIWRKSYGAYDLNESNLRKEYLNDGVVFTHSKDIDGKPLLIFKTKLHTKGVKDMDEVMRVVVYWIERIHRETHMDKITIFFDMAGTGLAGMDIEFVKQIITTFKLYYPNALNYIIIFEMAWILNAAFKIIKGLLPAKALEILRILTKKDINSYVDKDNCLTSWGGTDDYSFKFVPEGNSSIKLSPSTAIKANGVTPVSPANVQHNNNHHEKKVHFANSSPENKSKQMKDIEDHHTPQDYDMLRVSPKEFISFTRGECTESSVDISCISKFSVTYKIQTTSPDKFRVRPRCGVLSSGESVSVNILLKPEHQLAEASKDKFLVMCTAVPSGLDTSDQAQIANLWKSKPLNSPDVEQHRLCCVYKQVSTSAGAGGNGGTSGGSETVSNGFAHGGDILEGKKDIKIADLSKHAQNLENQLKFTQVLQGITIVFLVILSVAVIYLLKLQVLNDETLEESKDCIGDSCGGDKVCSP